MERVKERMSALGGPSGIGLIPRMGRFTALCLLGFESNLGFLVRRTPGENQVTETEATEGTHGDGSPAEELQVLRRANPRMEKDVAVGTEGVPQPEGAGCPNQIKELGQGGALSKRTPGQLRSDHSLLQSKPKAPATPGVQASEQDSEQVTGATCHDLPTFGIQMGMNSCLCLKTDS